MNDRGLSLTPTDMLKGYLLANIDDADKRIRPTSAGGAHRELCVARQGGGRRRLQGLAAQPVRRERSVSARRTPGPRTSTHRHGVPSLGPRPGGELGLKSAGLRPLHRPRLHLLRTVPATPRPPTPDTRPGARPLQRQHGFTLQYPVLLAPLRRDDRGAVLRKLRLVAMYLDILSHGGCGTPAHRVLDDAVRDVPGDARIRGKDPPRTEALRAA